MFLAGSSGWATPCRCWEDNQSVDKKPLFADLTAGLAITVNAVRIAYTYVYRTKEFDGQDGADKFASISLSFRW